MVARPRVAVVGAGISGLATAYFLQQLVSTDLDIRVFEAADRAGGKILTKDVLGLWVDLGPDTISAQPGAFGELLSGCGLADATVGPGVSGSYLWSRGRLRRAPAGAMMGLSSNPWPLVRGGLLSPLGALRAGLDLVRPRTDWPPDPSVGQIVRTRFGDQICDRLAGPMLSGAYSGGVDDLSAGSVLPDLAALARTHRSLYLAMRRKPMPPGRSAAKAPGAPFFTIDGGLGRVVDALVRSIGPDRIRTGTTVRSIDPAGAGYRVSGDRGEPLYVDAVVLAVPAFAASGMLAGISPAVATALREIRYAGITTVTLAYSRDAIARPLDATGFLVPKAEGRTLLGCTWLSAKWPPLDHQPVVPIRCLVGGEADGRTLDASDAELTKIVHGELVEAMGLTAEPVDAIVARWPHAIAQYTVGHGDRLGRLDAGLASSPGIYLTGAGYRGASVARCVEQAYQSACAVVQRLATLGSGTVTSTLVASKRTERAMT